MYIVTNVGSRLRVPNDFSEEDTEILKSARMFDHSEFIYTGNSPKGQNYDNGKAEEFLRTSGLTIEDDTDYGGDISILLYNLEMETGIARLRHRGKTLVYHVQTRRGETHHGFGYTVNIEYRKIRLVED